MERPFRVVQFSSWHLVAEGLVATILFILVRWYIGSLRLRTILTLWLSLRWWRLAHLHWRSTDTTELHSIGILTLTAGTNHVLASFNWHDWIGYSKLLSTNKIDLYSRFKNSSISC